MSLLETTPRSLNVKFLIINDKCIGIQDFVDGLSDHFLAGQGMPDNSSLLYSTTPLLKLSSVILK